MRLTIGRFVVGAVCTLGAATAFGPLVFAAQPSVTPRFSTSDVTVPAWLYPSAPAPAPGTQPAVFDSVTPIHLPRVRVAFTESQLHNLYSAPDWDPTGHPAMPQIVAHGRPPAVYACAFCHMPDGSGRPENASLAGLPAGYIIQQVADMKSHARSTAWQGGAWAPYDNMRKVAEAATDSDVAVAAQYFSRLKPRQRTRIIEASLIPHIKPGTGLYSISTGAGTEPLGARIIEAPMDMERHERRDPYLGYVAYVPVGSIVRGKRLTTKPMNDAKQVCGSCHGPALKGMGVIPSLAGTSPGYVVRQLLAFKSGARNTTASAPMQIVAKSLSLDDMIAVAAYAATLKR